MHSFLLLLVLSGLSAPPAAAQAPGNKKEARVHYQRGVGLYKEANYSAALAEFRAAYQALPSFEVLFNIGLCERRLFKYGRALGTLNQYLHEGGPKVPSDRRAAVAQELAQIRQLTAPIAVIVGGPPAQVLIDGEAYAMTPLTEMVPLGPGRHLVRAERAGFAPDEKAIEVVSGQAQAVQFELKSLSEPVAIEVMTAPPGATLTVDGQESGTAPSTVPMAPGTHEVVARLEGHHPARTDVVVQPGQPRTVKVTLMALPVALAVAAGPPLPKPRPVPVLGVSVLGGGLLVGGAGAVFALQAKALAARVTALSQSAGAWDASWARLETQGRRANLLGWSLIGAGGAALAVGAVLSLVALLKDPEAPRAAWLVLPDSHGGLVVSCAVSF